MRKTPWSTTFLFAGVMFAGCSGGGGNDAGGTDTPMVDTPPGEGGPPCPSDFASVQVIFTASCTVGGVTCHGSTGTGGSLHLDPGNSYGNIVSRVSNEYGLGVTPATTMDLVQPGDITTSFLYHKLIGDLTTLPGCNSATDNCGVMMPMVGGAALTSTQLCTIRTWITMGAQM